MAVTRMSPGWGFGVDWTGDIQAFTGIRGDGVSQAKRADSFPNFITDVTSKGSRHRKLPSGWLRSTFGLNQPGSYGIWTQSSKAPRTGADHKTGIPTGSSQGLPASKCLLLLSDHCFCFLEVVSSKPLRASSPLGKPPAWKTELSVTHASSPSCLCKLISTAVHFSSKASIKMLSGAKLRRALFECLVPTF